MSLFTAEILKRMSPSFDTEVIDLANNYSRSLLPWRVARSLAAMRSVARILQWRSKEDALVYLAGNSGAGLLSTLIQVLACRLGGLPVIYHHHTFASLWDIRMKLIVRLLGKVSLHIVATDEMADDLVIQFGRDVQILLMKPSLLSATGASGARARRITSAPLRVGHLSNLTLEKGLAEVLATARLGKERRLKLDFRIAGPISSADARRIVDEATDIADYVTFEGPVYGAKKQAFYDSVDLFLFPSSYRNETWAMVVDEAMAAGLPIISSSFCGAQRIEAHRGSASAGLVVPLRNPFPDAAIGMIERWLADPDLFQDASIGALALATDLEQQAEGEISTLIERSLELAAVTSPLTTGSPDA